MMKQWKRLAALSSAIVMAAATLTYFPSDTLQNIRLEISASAETSVCEVKAGTFKSYTISPEQFGLTRCKKEELTGGTPDENAAITKAVLAGEQGAGRTAVVLNAGAGLYVAGKADSIEAGVRLAEELIDSGKAEKKLEEFVKYSNM